MPDHQTSRYAAGVFWAGLNAVSSVLMPFGLFVFFAREMSPPDVGLVALAMACSEILKALCLPGLYEALLQQKHDQHRCHETALTLLLSLGLAMVPVCVALLYGLSLLIAGLGAHLLLLGTVALRIPLDLATIQPQAMLVARLSYKRLAVRSVVASLLSGSLGVGVAMNAHPMAGLVVYQVSQSLLIFASSAVGHGLLVRPRFHPDCFSRLRREAMLATGNRTLAASINYVDQMIMAPLAGDIALAYYNLGKRLETTFVTVANSFSSILFQPLFARGDAATRQEAARRAVFVLALVCGIPAAVFLADTRPIVATVFGRQWLAAGPVAALLTINGLVRAVGMIPGALLCVCGRNQELLVTSIASAAGGILLVVSVAPSSITACALLLTLKNGAIVAWMVWLSRREAPGSARYYGVALATVILMFAAAAVASWSVSAEQATGMVWVIATAAASALAALLTGAFSIGLVQGARVRELFSRSPTLSGT